MSCTKIMLLAGIAFYSCGLAKVNGPKKQTNVEVAQKIVNLKLPKGFKIEVFANDIDNARSITKANDHEIYVGTRDAGNVYAVIDQNKDYIADSIHTLIKGANMPNGVVYHEGDLYLAEVSKISKVPNISKNYNKEIVTETIYDKFPTETHHGWKFISIGPDGKLYVPVGAPCNVCESEDRIFNTITRMNLDGTDLEIIQEGVRNTVGFDWHPTSSELWFTDNNRDWLDDDLPACELNKATQDGQHFGFPYCHQGDLPDPEFGAKYPCTDFVAPAMKLGPHSAPLGCEFYQGGMFPESYNNCIFIAEHGSWNRSKKIGYRVSLVRLDENNNAIAYEDFISGWLNKTTDEAWGRPVDLEWLSDGSLLISDDYADKIYRVTYSEN